MSFVLPHVTSQPALRGLTRHELFAKLATATGLLQTGQATGGSVDYLEDTTRLRSSQYSPQDWAGGWVRIGQTTDKLAPISTISPIVSYDPGLGRVNFTQIGATVDPGDKYELWKVDPGVVVDIVNDALENELYEPCWSILSEIPDYDMEQPGVDYWTAVNANVAKATSHPRISTSGKRYLEVTATAPEGYAESSTMAVEPTHTLWVSAVTRAVLEGTTARLELWDVSNDRLIDSITHNRQHAVRLGKWMQVPSVCSNVSVRLVSVESGAVTEWVDVALFSSYSTDISAPWWVENQDDIKGVFRLDPLSTRMYAFDVALRGEQDYRFDVYPNKFGSPKYQIVSRAGTISWPLFVYGLRHETPYEDDLDIKFIEAGFFLACVKYKLYDYLSQPLVTGIVQHNDAKEKLPIAYREYVSLKHLNNPPLNHIIDSDTPHAGFLDSRFRFGS